MTIRNCIRTTAWAGLLALALLMAACGSAAEPPLPTRTPAPTFTPTTESAPPAVQQPAPAQDTPAAPAEQPPAQEVQTEGPPPTPAPAQEVAATPTPAPAAAEVVANTTMNVRGGPGTNYNIVGAANQGQRYPVIGKSPDGTWWQINYNGQPGWVFGELVTAQNTQAVAVAANIPQPPPPTATPIPQPTPVPQPAPAQPTTAPQPAPEQPTAAPAEPGLEFSRAILQRCDPNGGVTYVNGTVYKNGQPVNGYNVAFSYAPDGPVVASVISGPHAGYEGWNAGFYSHILKSDGPREGNWFFWITDSSGKRISKVGNVHTDAEAGDGKCQQAIIDFDS
jgi:uncharacterized protein YraI